MSKQILCCFDSTVCFSFICCSIILKLAEILLHQELMRESWNFSLQFLHFNLNWNSHQFTSQVFSIFKSTEIERADSALIIMLWFFLFSQKKILFFSNLSSIFNLSIHESSKASSLLIVKLHTSWLELACKLTYKV